MSDQSACPITNELHCKCRYERPPCCISDIDMKSALRKLWSDHSFYTALVLKSIVSGLDDTQVFLSRLLANQKDIGDQLALVVGCEKGNRITAVLTEHIKLAGDVITAATKKDPMLQNKIDKLFMNSDDVACVLSSLNPIKLPYPVIQKMFRVHNQFVIDMTVARIKKDYLQEQKLFDAYYCEILMMSDSIYNAL